MDLVLLQPGDAEVFGGANSLDNGGSSIDSARQDSVLELGPCIELVSMHYGMKQQVTADISIAARTSGRPAISELTLIKYVDGTSIKFYEYCLRAEPIGKGKDKPTRLHIVRNSGDTTSKIITISLRDAIISEIQLQSHPNDMPTEQFKLNFTEILWAATTQDSSGTTVNSSTGWSIARNRPITQFAE